MFQEGENDSFPNSFDKIASIAYNYGEILNSSCCDLSKDNRIIVGTKKCLILLNLNIDMKKINASLGSKFNLNEAITAYVMPTPKLNKDLKNFFCKFFNFNELKDDENKKQSKGKKRKRIDLNYESDDGRMMEIDENFIKNNLFDPSIYEFIGSLNAFHSSNSQSNSKEDTAELRDESTSHVKKIAGFRCCKWNENTNYSVLASITDDNQIILFYCDRLDTSKKFDENKIFNLSEFWLKNRKYNKSEKLKVSDEYVDALYNMIPNCIKWSKEINSCLDLLFISFKSNNIAIFSLQYSNLASNNKVEFVSVISIDDQNNLSDSYFNLNKIIRNKSQISSLHFENINDFYSFLVIGLINGDILFKKLNLKFSNGLVTDTTSSSSSNITSFSMPDKSYSNKIETIKLTDSKYLVIIQKEFQLAFFFTHLTQDNNISVNEASLVYTKHLMQNRLISFSSLKSYNDELSCYLLTYENDSYDLINLNLDIENEKIKIENFNSFQLDLNKSAKSVKNLLLTSNQFLFFQINDHSITNLLKKKPVDFYINIYQKKADEIISSRIVENVFQDNKLLNVYSDFLWLFKSYLYFNDFNETFIKHSHDTINSLIATHETCKKISRILNAYLVYYFETLRNEDSRPAESKKSNFYRINHKELSINLIKHRIVELIDHAYLINFKKLNETEKFILLIQSDFAVFHKFYGQNEKEMKILESINENLTNHFELSKDENGESLMKKLMNNYKRDANSPTEINLRGFLKKFLRCNICGKYTLIENNIEMNYIECEFGHKIKRCIKSFLPLNLKKTKKCFLCEIEWNVYSENELPNFTKLFNDMERLCVFCD